MGEEGIPLFAGYLLFKVCTFVFDIGDIITLNRKCEHNECNKHYKYSIFIYPTHIFLVDLKKHEYTYKAALKYEPLTELTALIILRTHGLPPTSILAQGHF